LQSAESLLRDIIVSELRTVDSSCLLGDCKQNNDRQTTNVEPSTTCIVVADQVRRSKDNASFGPIVLPRSRL